MQDLVNPLERQASRFRYRSERFAFAVCLPDLVVPPLQRGSRLGGGSRHAAEGRGSHATSRRPVASEERKISSISLQLSVPASARLIACRTFGVSNSRANSRQMFSEADIPAPFVVGVEAKFMSSNLDDVREDIKGARHHEMSQNAEVSKERVEIAAALDLAMQAWRTVPSARDRITNAIAAVGWLDQRACIFAKALRTICDVGETRDVEIARRALAEGGISE